MVVLRWTKTTLWFFDLWRFVVYSVLLWVPLIVYGGSWPAYGVALLVLGPRFIRLKRIGNNLVVTDIKLIVKRQWINIQTVAVSNVQGIDDDWNDTRSTSKEVAVNAGLDDAWYFECQHADKLAAWLKPA